MKRGNKISAIVFSRAISSLTAAIVLCALTINASASVLVIGNGKIIKRIEVEAALTGNPIGGLTPTGTINSSYFPSFIGQTPLVTDRAVINNLNLPAAVEQIDYFLNNSATKRASIDRFSDTSWGVTILQFGDSARILPGTTVQVKNGSQVVASGTFARPIRNFESYDTALSGRFVVPPITVSDEVTSVAVVKFFPAENRLNYDILIFNVSEGCTGITLNDAAEGFNGPVVAALPFTTAPTDGGFRCAAEGNLTLTAAQAALLRGNELYLSVQTSSRPNGVQRGQLEKSVIEADFGGDGAADLALFRPSSQTWYIQDVQTNQFSAFAFGSAGSKALVNDFDGDSVSDPAVFDAAQGLWTIRKSSENAEQQISWGLPGDVPLTGEYFGGGSDIAVFRPSEGVWYIRRCGDIIKPIAGSFDSSNYQIVQWGQNGDKPLMADFNGDGRDELAVYRPSNGTWYIFDPRTQGATIVQWGAGGDVPVAADYDGDGRDDVAVFRPSNGVWYVYGSAEERLIAVQFGQNGDIPAVSDYDKDGVSDTAVFRPSNGGWYILKSSDNSFYAAGFGADGDVPVVAE